MNRLAVFSLTRPTSEERKNDPRFCLLSSIVGGLASSGMIDDSSTDGGGASVCGEVVPDVLWSRSCGAVEERKGREVVRARLGFGVSSVIDEMALVPRIVAFDTELSKLRPTARA